MTKWAIKIVDFINQAECPIEEQYIKSFDHDAFDGQGAGEFTFNIREALPFADTAEALMFWKKQSEVRPLRSDGKPNRPLTCSTVTLEQIPEGPIQKHFYISFADTKRFYGATVVVADNTDDAMLKASLNGLNPGVDAAIVEIPPEYIGEPDVQPFIGKLLSEEDCRRLGCIKHGDLTEDEKKAVEDDMTWIPRQ